MANFSYIIPYYKNPEMLKIHVDVWNQYDKGWDFIVVDDGSPTDPAAEIIKSLSKYPKTLRVYRVNEDIPWNAHGAKNLGALVAKFGWMYMTDVDTILLPSDAEKLTEMKENFGQYYMFNRKRSTDQSDKNPHPNTFLVHRYQFWEVGGYDCDYCDHSYGGDRQFTDLLDKKYKQVMIPEIYIQYYPEDKYPGASVRDWPKKDGPFHQEYRFRLRDKNKARWNTPQTPIRFTWSRVL